MKTIHRKWTISFLLAAGSIAGNISQAQQKVSITFNDFHGYTGTVQYLNKIAAAYPEITELMEIGKTNMGRSIYVLVISNMKTGTVMDAHVRIRNPRAENVQNVPKMKSFEGKPGHWIDGGIHGNEFTGTEVTLYIIDKLVSGYNADSAITKLVDANTFYICPIINPDGAFNSSEREITQRENSQLIDNDGDGEVNEDGPDDLNGDGHVTQMRYEDPQGRFVIDDVEPRLMVRLGANESTAKIRYSVITEDKDNDGDGKRGEDSEAGIDLNRNFPQAWFKPDGLPGGSGAYATSAPETRAIVEFFTRYRNILLAQTFHTSGGFVYRAPATTPDSVTHPKDVAVYDLIMGKKYLEIMGDKIPPAWQNPEAMDSFREELRKTSKDQVAVNRGYEMPPNWIYNRDGVLAFGVISDWLYLQQGVYALAAELWNPQKDIPGIPAFTGGNQRIQLDRYLIKYQDEKYGGKHFLPWKPFKHPELGDVEIGGWITKYGGGNNAFPGEPLLGICEKYWHFERFRAGLLPDATITDVTARVVETTDNVPEARVSSSDTQVNIQKHKSKGKYRIVEIAAKIENKGALATHTGRGPTLPGNREDQVWLIGDRDKIKFLEGTPVQRIGVLEGTMAIPGYRPAPSDPSAIQPQAEGPQRQSRQEGPPATVKRDGNKCEVRWIVAIEGQTPLKIVLSSQKGGTKVKEVVLN